MNTICSMKPAVVICGFALLALASAHAPLRSAMRVQEKRQPLLQVGDTEEETIVNIVDGHVSSNNGRDQPAKKILQQDDPEFIEYKLPFSATPYYDYLDNFLVGLKIETRIKTIGKCIDAVVYMLDDYSYLQNNISDFKSSAWEAPILNFTNAVGGNFSLIPGKCYESSIEGWDKSVSKFESFASIGDFFTAFLFNLMGNALKFNQAFADIENNKKNQFYVDIAQQYGKIIRLIFEFDASDLTASTLGESNTFLKSLLDGRLRYSESESSPYASLSDIEKELAEKFYDLQDSVFDMGFFQKLLAKQALTYVSSILDKEMNMDYFRALKSGADRKVKISDFDGSTSGSKAGKGFVNGMIDALPEGSFLNYCQDNVTDLSSNSKKLKGYYEETKYQSSLDSVHDVLQKFSGSMFNCFYAVKDPTSIDGESKGFGPEVLAWNILFNTGFMYNDVVKIRDYMKDSNTSDNWEDVGYRAGDFFIRIFWSRYKPRKYRFNW